MVAGQRHGHHRTHDDLAVAGDGPILDRADREDRRLRRVEHGDELLDAVHAEVGDREGAALEVFGPELAAAGSLHQVDAGRGDLRDRAPVAAADHRHDEPVGDRDREADVGARVALDRLAGEACVDGAVAHQRGGARLREDVGQRRLRARRRRARRRRACSSCARVMSADIEIWNAGACQASVRRRAIVRRTDESCSTSTSPDGGATAAGAGALGDRCAGFHPLDVLGHDPSLRPGSRERREVDPALARDATRERRGLDPAAVAHRLGLPSLRDLLARTARGAPPALALLLARRRRRAFLLRILVDLLRGRAVAGAAQVGRLLALPRR